MLNESWDVLNLFDIVRLYDIRDGKKQKMVLSQVKQLIGRRARYYPFILGNPEEKYTRKFGYNEANEL